MYSYIRCLESFLRSYMKRDAEITTENAKLKEEIYRLKRENENLKAELRSPERMTAAESNAYWGIFG